MRTDKYLMLAGILLSFCSAFAQNTANEFKISGMLSGKVDSVNVKYKDVAGVNTSKTVAVTNGRFVLQGFIKSTLSCTIKLIGNQPIVSADSKKSQSTVNFFIEPGEMKIFGNADDLKSLKMEGSKPQNDYYTFSKIQEPNNEKASKLRAELKTETSDEKKAELKKQIEQLSKDNERLVLNFFNQNPQSYITSYYLALYQPMYPLNSVKEIYNKFTPAQKQSEMGKMIGETIRGMEAGSPGQMAMDFKTTDVNGKPIALSDFKGKYVIVDFWASWCVPCRNSHPHLIEWYNAYKDKGLVIIGVASDDGNEKAWRKAIADDGVGIWHHVLAGVDKQKAMKREPNPADIMAKYGVTALPTKLIIDPTGKIVARDIGDGKGIGEKLKEIFGKK